MKKNLIALAVAGATLAPAAMAQTANPVTLYGRAYLTLESVEAKGGAAPVARRTQLQDQSSMFGIRGTEDLGGGLKAFFQLETVFRLDQTGSSFANRNSGVGLQGGWGSFLMGRWDMPFKTGTIAIDPYGDLTIGGITAANNDQGNFDRRDPNVVQYWSPNFAGFAFRLARQVNEGKTASLNPYNQGANVTYSRGPVYAVVAWEEHKDVSASVPKEEGLAVGGSFVFGPVKVGLLAEEFKKTGRTKKKSWMANVVWTAGSHQLIYQYQQAKDGAASGAVTQPDCKVHQPGYQYNFSRRTFFIAQYARVDNNAGSNCGQNIVAHAAGQDPQGISVGLRHVF